MSSTSDGSKVFLVIKYKLIKLIVTANQSLLHPSRRSSDRTVHYERSRLGEWRADK